jgi:hypothetical protein
MRPIRDRVGAGCPREERHNKQIRLSRVGAGHLRMCRNPIVSGRCTRLNFLDDDGARKEVVWSASFADKEEDDVHDRQHVGDDRQKPD